MDESDMRACGNTAVLTEREFDIAMETFKAETLNLQGAKNFGNTCYINSVLQCLLKATPLGSALKTHNRHMCLAPKEVCFLCLIRKIAEYGCEQADAVLRTLANNVAKLGSFRRLCQEDAHEFFREIVDNVNLSFYNSYVVEAEAQRSPSLEQTTLPNRILSGWSQSEVRCKECSTTSKVYQPFIDISVPLVHDTLQDNLRSVFSSDTLKEYKCDHCKKEVTAEKRTSLYSVPPVLVLQFQLFVHHGNNGATMKHRKHVSYGHSLDVKEHIKNRNIVTPTEYSLSGLVCHTGRSASSGHYTSFIEQRGVWVSYDDSTARHVAPHLIPTLQPYMLFYLRRDCVPAKLASPPRPILAFTPYVPSVSERWGGVTPPKVERVERRREEAVDLVAPRAQRGRERQLHPTKPLQHVGGIELAMQKGSAQRLRSTAVVEEARMEREQKMRLQAMKNGGVLPGHLSTRVATPTAPTPTSMAAGRPKRQRSAHPLPGLENGGEKRKEKKRRVDPPKGNEQLHFKPVEAPPPPKRYKTMPKRSCDHMIQATLRSRTLAEREHIEKVVSRQFLYGAGRENNGGYVLEEILRRDRRDDQYSIEHECILVLDSPATVEFVMSRNAEVRSSVVVGLKHPEDEDPYNAGFEREKIEMSSAEILHEDTAFAAAAAVLCGLAVHAVAVPPPQIPAVSLTESLSTVTDADATSANGNGAVHTIVPQAQEDILVDAASSCQDNTPAPNGASFSLQTPVNGVHETPEAFDTVMAEEEGAGDSVRMPAEEFKAQLYERVLAKLEGGEPKCAALWKQLKHVGLQSFQSTVPIPLARHFTSLRTGFEKCEDLDRIVSESISFLRKMSGDEHENEQAMYC